MEKDFKITCWMTHQTAKLQEQQKYFTLNFYWSDKTTNHKGKQKQLPDNLQPLHTLTSRFVAAKKEGVVLWCLSLTYYKVNSNSGPLYSLQYCTVVKMPTQR